MNTNTDITNNNNDDSLAPSFTTDVLNLHHPMQWDQTHPQLNDNTDIDNNNARPEIVLNLHHPVQWDQTLPQLKEMKKQKVPFDKATLRTLRRRLECNGTPLLVLEQLITLYPKEFSFSIFLCTLRFPVQSNNLMDNIFASFKEESEANMDYCITKFHAGDRTKEKSDHTIIGEALTLIFSFTDDDFIATPQSGNIKALQIVKHKYPRSILYVDAHEFTPLHGVCSALNMDIFQYFINWHLEQNPFGRGGLYEMNDSGITSVDTLIDTQTNIVPTLQWLYNRTLLQSEDVNSWLLVHRASHISSISTIQFFLDLYHHPSAVIAEDADGNLPIHLHLGLRYRPHNTFSEEDFAITELLIRNGIKYNINTIGGLFHKNPDDKYCTLIHLLKEVGESNTERLWSMIRSCIDEAGGGGGAGNYSNALIIHAATRNKRLIPNGSFKEILRQFGAMNCEEYDGERGSMMSDILETDSIAIKKQRQV